MSDEIHLLNETLLDTTDLLNESAGMLEAIVAHLQVLSDSVATRKDPADTNVIQLRLVK